jgi:hypothetical protein
MYAKGHEEWKEWEVVAISTGDWNVMHILKHTHVAPKLTPMVSMNESEAALRDGVIRVSINTDGTLDILDFTLPSFSREARRKRNVPQEDAPQWVMNALAVLQVAEPHVVVDDVGYRLPSNVFYLLDPETVERRAHVQEETDGRPTA